MHCRDDYSEYYYCAKSSIPTRNQICSMCRLQRAAAKSARRRGSAGASWVSAVWDSFHISAPERTTSLLLFIVTLGIYLGRPLPRPALVASICCTALPDENHLCFGDYFPVIGTSKAESRQRQAGDMERFLKPLCLVVET